MCEREIYKKKFRLNEKIRGTKKNKKKRKKEKLDLSRAEASGCVVSADERTVRN